MTGTWYVALGVALVATFAGASPVNVGDGPVPNQSSGPVRLQADPAPPWDRDDIYFFTVNWRLYHLRKSEWDGKTADLNGDGVINYLDAVIFLQAKLTGAPAMGATRRASVGTGGLEGNGDSTRPAISGDGRYVAFCSAASNLVPGDTNGAVDVFVADRQTGRLERVSVADDGTQGDRDSWRRYSPPSVSDDGRYVAFCSTARNLVPNDTNNEPDIFVRDCLLDRTTRISLGPGGVQANGDCSTPRISGDGRLVAYTSSATNLVTGDTNGTWDIFVCDTAVGATTRASVSSSGEQANGASFTNAYGAGYLDLSRDGRYVAFCSYATNLVAIDTNDDVDVFRHDLLTGETVRVSEGAGGTQANGPSSWPSISSGGRYVAFRSSAANLVAGDTGGADDIFVRDCDSGQTTRASVATDGSEAVGRSGDSWGAPALSGSGRYVAFTSEAKNLTPGDVATKSSDLYVRDLQTQRTFRASVPIPGGTIESHLCSYPSISEDGRFVAFQSAWSALVEGDTNGRSDVFVRDLFGYPIPPP